MTITKETIGIGAGCLIGLVIIGAVRQGQRKKKELRDREILEETGLDVTGAEGGFQFCYHRENPGEGDNYFADVYKFIMDFDESDVKPQPEETLGYKLATPEEIKALADEGIFLHYDSVKQIFS